MFNPNVDTYYDELTLLFCAADVVVVASKTSVCVVAEGFAELFCLESIFFRFYLNL